MNEVFQCTHLCSMSFKDWSTNLAVGRMEHLPGGHASVFVFGFWGCPQGSRCSLGLLVSTGISLVQTKQNGDGPLYHKKGVPCFLCLGGGCVCVCVCVCVFLFCGASSLCALVGSWSSYFFVPACGLGEGVVSMGR